jgi:glycopeptide antibiotics resistance protein
MHELITKLYQLALSSHIVSTLLEPVHIVILALPIMTLLLAMIILTIQLRTRQTLSERNLISTYSFIWYLAAAYLLIILPLPTRSSVASLTTAEYNLQPFYFLTQLKALTPFELGDPSTWLAAFKSDTFFQPFFNVLLFMPIGAYLKWRHRWPLWLITLTSFLDFIVLRDHTVNRIIRLLFTGLPDVRCRRFNDEYVGGNCRRLVSTSDS